MANNSSDKRLKINRIKLPIRSVLIIPFMLQLILSIGVTGWVSIRNSRRAIDDISLQLREHSAKHIEDQLEQYLSVPHLLNEINHDALGLGYIDLNNLDEVYRHFYRQIDNFEEILSIFLGLENGHFIGNGNFGELQNQMMISDSTNGGSIRFYDVDSQGESTSVVKEVPNFNTRDRPWYGAAVEAEQSTWGEVFTYHAFPLMAVPAVKPIYDSNGTLLGVLGNNYFLSQIGEFLSEFEVGENGQVFIVERSGLLIAGSSISDPFTIEDDGLNRINIADLEDPIIQSMLAYVLNSHVSLESISGSVQQDFQFNDERHFLGISTYADEWGLDWLVLIVIPESDFLAQVQSHTNLTLFICVGAMLLASGLGIQTSRWLSRPILQLSKSTHGISKELQSSRKSISNYSGFRTKITSPIREISTLSNSFGVLIETLDKTLIDLEASNSYLEQKVERRTKKIIQALGNESTLMRISDSVRESLNEEKILKAVVNETALALRVPYCSTGIYNLESKTSKIVHEYTNRFPSYLGRSIDMEIFPYRYDQLRERQYILYCDIARNLDRDLTSVLMVSISERNDVYGDILIVAEQDRVFSNSEIRLAQQIAAQCAIAIRQARLYRSSQVRAEELNNLHTLKDDFLSTVSHELRSPMSSIKMATQMLEVSLEKAGLLSDRSQPITRYLDILQAESDREIFLINDILDLARLEDDSLTLNIQDIDPSLLIHELSKPICERACKQNQRIELDIPGDLPLLKTDPDYFQRMLSELMHNACKYTPPGELIRVSARTTGKKLCVRVCNTGVNLSQAQCNLVFNKFYRVPNNDPWKHGGTGLGLALVKRIADALEADIKLTCFDGVFIFALNFDLMK